MNKEDEGKIIAEARKILSSVLDSTDDKTEILHFTDAIILCVSNKFSHDAARIIDYQAKLFLSALTASVKNEQQDLVLADIVNEMFSRLDSDYKCIKIN